MQQRNKRITLIIRIIAVMLAVSSVFTVWINYNTAFRSALPLIRHFLIVFIASAALCFLTYYLQQKEPAEDLVNAYIRYHVIAAAFTVLFLLFVAATKVGRSIGFWTICLSTILFYSAPIVVLWRKNR